MVEKTATDVILNLRKEPKAPSDLFQYDAKYEKCGFATRAIHAGNDPDPAYGGVSPAIDLSTTYAQPAPGQPLMYDYQRCGNPTRTNFERNLAAMEHGKYAMAFNSGCAATSTIMNMLSSGDHVLCVDDVYGGTQRYLRRILNERANISITFLDFSDLEELKKAITEKTKFVWLETPTNPTLKIFDIAAVAKVVKEKGSVLVVDNTFFSPVLQNPLDLGADICYHSVSKYIGGHSDVIGGALIMNDKDLYDKLAFNMKTLGTGAAPFESWLALRGTKTLSVRVKQATANAEKIAAMLEGHAKVSKVVYPGLASHPQHELCKKQARGFGAMISFYVASDINGADRFLRALKLVTLAESLGGVESLIENPALMTHGSVPAEHRKLLGIEDNFIRMSVGIEDIDDLMADLQNALSAI